MILEVIAGDLKKNVEQSIVVHFCKQALLIGTRVFQNDFWCCARKQDREQIILDFDFG